MRIPLEQQGVKATGVKRTDIEWADYSVNPIRARLKDDPTVVGWACVRVSDGCRFCYASTLNERFGTGLEFSAQDDKKVEWWLDDAVLDRMLGFRPRGPFKNGRERPAVFVGDMTDVFNERVKDECLDKMFGVFALRADVDWLVLTKRPERMRDYFARPWAELGCGGKTELNGYEGSNIFWDKFHRDYGDPPWPKDANPWPLPNVWLGVSAERQKEADERVPVLLDTPAAVRFVSYEPALGPVDFGEWIAKISLVIVGGESGAGARPFNVTWADDVRDKCASAGVAFYMKQFGAKPYDPAWHGDGTPEGSSMMLNDPKGGDMSEWPADLRVRQMPGQKGATA